MSEIREIKVYDIDTNKTAGTGPVVDSDIEIFSGTRSSSDDAFNQKVFADWMAENHPDVDITKPNIDLRLYKKKFMQEILPTVEVDVNKPEVGINENDKVLLGDESLSTAEAVTKNQTPARRSVFRHSRQVKAEILVYQ